MSDLQTGRFIYGKNFEEGVDAVFSDPTALTADEEKLWTKKEKYNRECKEAERLTKQYETDKVTVIMKIKSMCLRDMKRELRTMKQPKTFSQCLVDCDLNGFLKAMDGIIFQTSADSKVCPPLLKALALCKVMDTRDRPGQDIDIHGRNWEANNSTFDTLWGNFQPYINVGSGMSKEDQIKEGERFKAALFLTSVDQENTRRFSLLSTIPTSTIVRIITTPRRWTP